MTGPMRTRGSLQRAKTPGWSAFDMQQRQKQGEVNSADVDPFPPLIHKPPSSSLHVQRGLNLGSVKDKNYLKQKNADVSAICCKNISFMSVGSGFKSAESDNVIDPYPSTSLPMAHNNNRGVTDQVSKTKNQLELEKLKGLYPWADKSLIEDVLVAVGYEHQQASVSLESMLETDKSSELSAICEALERATTEEGCGVKCHASFECLGSGAAEQQEAKGFMPVPPPEPELWEEDNVYWKHRKDGLRMSRAAGRHSRNAQNAYMRGDHRTARLFSKKSQQEYLAAENLNAKAATEILCIINEKHDVWKLDLHGLHASEAVDALASHLQMIEYNVFKNISASSGPTVGQKDNCDVIQQSPKVVTAIMSTPSELQVITGSGVHSRGGASLPMAIKNFLIDKGYKFSEARAGVIAVRPKFRYC